MSAIIDYILSKLSSDPTENMELIALALAQAAQSGACYIVLNDEEGQKVIGSTRSEDVVLRPEAFEKANNAKGFVMLPPTEGFLSVACTPLIDETKSRSRAVDRRKQYDYKSTKGYLYFDGIDEKHFDATFLSMIKEASQLLINVVEFFLSYQTASTDKLTGALTRKHMDIALEACLERAKLNNHSFAVLLMDIDLFKHINDNYGHLVGDEVLGNASRFIMERLRKGDLLGRYGGEEFLAMLNGLSCAEAADFADNLRKSIHGAKFLGDKRDVTMSMGLAVYPTHSDTVRSLIGYADIALYVAKQTGRNKIEVYRDEFESFTAKKDQIQAFFTGDNSKDSQRLRSLYHLIKINNKKLSVQDKVRLVLDETAKIVEAEDLTFFSVNNGEISDTYMLSRFAKITPSYNDAVISGVIKTGQPVCFVDWDNEKTDNSSGLVDWHSLVVAPALYKGCVKGVLYANASVKRKEFSDDESSYIQKAAGIIALMY